MTTLIKYYQKTSLLFLCGLLSFSIGVKKTYAVIRLGERIKQIVSQKIYYPKGYPYGRVIAPANPSAAFSTPSFHDSLSNGRRSALDAKKINFTMFPKQTPSFFGRATEMGSLAPYFKKKDKLVILPPIIGFDGVGKTQLALQLIEQHGDQYDYIVWINASSAQDIEASYHQIAKELGIVLAPNQNLKAVIRLVQEKLKDKRVLYVCDNANDLKTIQPYFKHGHILITSSNSATMDWQSSHYDAPLNLAPFSEAEALDFAKAMGADPKEPSLRELIGLLPKYPLLLSQLINGESAWRQNSFAYLLEHIKQDAELIRQLNENPHTYTTYQNALSYIIQSKLEALRSGENGEELLHLVQQLASLDAHPISNSILLLALNKEEKMNRTRDILSILEKNRLIKWGIAHTYMHSTIQTIVGNLYPLTSDQVGNLVDGYVSYNIDKIAAGLLLPENTYHQTILHGEKLLKYVEAKGGEDAHTAKCYLQLSSLYRQQGNAPTARTLGEKALNLFIQIHGENTPNIAIATAYNNLGLVCDYQGRYGQAIECYQKSLDIKQKVYGDNPHADIATAYNNLGLVYYNQGLFDEAITFFEKSLHIDQKIYGDQPHPHIATDYNNIGCVYDGKGDYAQALTFYEKSLEMKKEVYRNILHPSIATAYSNLGYIYDQEGQDNKAIEFYKKSLDMKQKIYGHIPHPHIATDYNELGLFYANQGKHAQAIEVCQNAFDMRKEVYRDIPHPKVAAAYHSLALIYESKGDMDMANHLYAKAAAEKAQYKKITVGR